MRTMVARILVLAVAGVLVTMLAGTSADRPAEAAIPTVVPTSGWLTQGFGGCSVQSQCHAAVDIAGPPTLPGNPVYAMADGVVVVRAQLNGSYGCYMVIDHGSQGTGQNVFSLYSHLGWEDAPDHTAGCYFDVAQGQAVSRGQKIGNQGDSGNATGVHLHFGVYVYAGPWTGAHHAFNPVACIGNAANYVALQAGTACGPDTCPQAIADWCLIRAMPSGNVYVLFGGAKFRIVNTASLGSLYPGQPVWDVADSFAASLPDTPHDETLLRDVSNGRIYSIVGGAKFHIPDPATLTSFYCPYYPSLSCHGNLPADVMAAIPDVPADGTLLHDTSDGAIYVTAGGARFHIPSMSVLTTLYCPAYPGGECFKSLWHSAVAGLPTTPRDGSLLRDVSDGAAHVIYGAARFRVPDSTTYEQMYCPSYPQQDCAQALWASAVAGIATVPLDDTLLKESNQSAVYAVCSGTRWQIPNPDVFNGLQFDWNQIRVLWPGGLTMPVAANTDTAVLPPGDRLCDGADTDDDNDAATDAQETTGIGSNPLDPDTDDDSSLDGADNCALWANPGGVLPAWPVAASDSDCDGFSAAVEARLGTAAGLHCPATGAPNDEAVDPWPADTNDDAVADLKDIVAIGSSFNSQSSSPLYRPRFDFTGDGQVSLADVVVFGPFYNKACS